MHAVHAACKSSMCAEPGRLKIGASWLHHLLNDATGCMTVVPVTPLQIKLHRQALATPNIFLRFACMRCFFCSSGYTGLVTRDAMAPPRNLFCLLVCNHGWWHHARKLVALVVTCCSAWSTGCKERARTRQGVSPLHSARKTPAFLCATCTGCFACSGWRQ